MNWPAQPSITRVIAWITLSVLICALRQVASAADLSAGESRLELLQPTARFREVVDLNLRGDRLIRYEKVVRGGLELSPLIRLSDRGLDLEIPTPEEFTNIEVFRLSESQQVVGFATRSLGHPDGNQRAIVWDWGRNKLHLLHPADGFRGSCAYDISCNGETVSGFVLGRNPPRMVPCVWQNSGGHWQCQLLPSPTTYNPFLTAGHVVISDDGRRVSASVVVPPAGELQGRINHLCQWEREAPGKWTRRVLAEHAVHVNEINDRGMVVGRVTRRGRRSAFVFDPNHGARILNPLPGDFSSEATDVNNAGNVVGVSDDPPGPNGGSVAFLWTTGRPRPMKFPVETLFSFARAITDDNRVGGWLAMPLPSDPAKGSTAAFILHLEDRR